MMRRIPFMLYRSGTSKGPFFLASDLPPCESKRDAMIAKIMGSGHPQQISGIGGAQAVTSKCCVVRPSVGDECSNYDLQYLFRQVEVDKFGVDTSHGDCGNMIAAVACSAHERGMISPHASLSSSTCRVHSEATGALFDITVQLHEGRVTCALQCAQTR